MKRALLFTLIMFILLLSACGTSTPAPTQKPLGTSTPVPTQKPLGTPTPTPTAKPLLSSACLMGKYVTDLSTIPDNSVLTPGAKFTKTWRFRNVGQCTWDGNYSVVAQNSSTMDQNSKYLLSAVGSKSTVAPGETVDISIDMQAPSTPGSYETDWVIQNDAGEVVPLGGPDFGGGLFSTNMQVK